MRPLPSAVLVCASLVLAACDPLAVENPNNPERDRVLGSPADLERFIANTWATYQHATIGAPPADQRPGGANDALQPQLRVAALENFAQIANFGMNVRYQIPRSFIDNQRGNPVEAGNYKDFLVLSRAARGAALGLARFASPGFTIGTPEKNARAQAFGRFVLGISLGSLALTYDSAAIVAPDDDLGVIQPLRVYTDVLAAAMTSLAAADSIAQANAAAFPLPVEWLNTVSTTSQADFIRLIRSFRAMLRAGVARDPAERAAVNWTAVIADAETGITADLVLRMNPAQGWDVAWFGQHFTPGGWHRMHQFMIGFADTSGAFDEWLSKSRATRTMFAIQTPDRRFPAGADRNAQQSASPTAPLPAGQYFRNRPPGDDVIGDPLGNSMYDHYRWRAFFDASRVGGFPVVTRAEIDLLAAEGYIRQGSFALAEAKINRTRTAAGLPAITGTASLSDPVPGGGGCVPRVPQPPDFTTTACGGILEAMKWEKRMETAYTGYGNWFFDSRGWGDLPQGSALHWPVPWQEMDTRRSPYYTMGGCGTLSGAAGTNTYGLSCTL